MDGGVCLYRGLAILGGNVLVASLRAFDGALLEDEGRNDPMPERGATGALEVVGEEQLFFDSDGTIGNGRPISGEGSSGEEKDSVGGENHFHVFEAELLAALWEGREREPY